MASFDSGRKDRSMTREQMSSADAAWLHMDRPTNLMVVNAVLWFDDPLDWPRVWEKLRQRLVAEFPRFRQRVVESSLPLDGPWWEDDPGFDLDAHVHQRLLPAPGDQGALQQVVAETMAMPLDRARPLWEVHLIDGYGRGCAMLFRVSHCIADGIALARVMLSLTDDGAEAGIALPQAAHSRSGPLGRLGRSVARTLTVPGGVAETVWRDLLEVTTHPSEATDRAAAGGRDVKALAKLLLTGHDADTVLKGEPGVARRVAWSSPLRLDEVKAVGRAFDATVNDVLLAAVTGALRSYLELRESLVDELRAIVPFNLRPLDEPLPRELGNRFGLVLLPLPVGISGRRERLAEVKRRMDVIKRSPEGAFSFGVLSAIGLIPAQLQNVVVGQFAARGTAVMTNVAGPQEPMHFAGAPVRGAVVWAPCASGVGISVSIFSYAGEVRLGLAVDADLVPEPQEIVDAFEVEYRKLAAPTRPSTPLPSLPGGQVRRERPQFERTT
jgi:diacylglycerol O-acyltransferase / wax synthase